ncbi:MAG TPA: FkbM family methyltransferase [Candidatus Acidoferrum sp.]|nr:FkbM family methyltransferase [Candidatus Acidoferrum sp.]
MNSTLHWSRRPFRGQHRVADAFGRVAEWVTAGRGISHPYPGVELETRLHDRLQRQMWAGTYETHVRSCLETLIDEGETILDVGAHIGVHSVTAAFLCGSRGRVAAFEPDPDLHRQLRKNLAQFPWAYAIYAAVWERSGDICFERSATRYDSASGTVVDIQDQGKGEIVRVPSIAIDDWAAKFGLGRIGMIKIDACGSEAAILRGAIGVVGQHQPILVLAFNGDIPIAAEANPLAALDLLAQLGYSVFRLSWQYVETWNAARHHAPCEILCLPAATEIHALSKLARAGFVLAT